MEPNITGGEERVECVGKWGVGMRVCLCEKVNYSAWKDRLPSLSPRGKALPLVLKYNYNSCS